MEASKCYIRLPICFLSFFQGRCWKNKSGAFQFLYVSMLYYILRCVYLEILNDPPHNIWIDSCCYDCQWVWFGLQVFKPIMLLQLTWVSGEIKWNWTVWIVFGMVAYRLSWMWRRWLKMGSVHFGGFIIVDMLLQLYLTYSTAPWL